MELSPKTGCNLSLEATPIFFGRLFLVVCVRYFEHSFRLVADLNGKKTSIEEFSPIFFLFHFGVNDRRFCVLAPY